MVFCTHSVTIIEKQFGNFVCEAWFTKSHYGGHVVENQSSLIPEHCRRRRACDVMKMYTPHIFGALTHSHALTYGTVCANIIFGRLLSPRFLLCMVNARKIDENTFYFARFFYVK